MKHELGPRRDSFGYLVLDSRLETLKFEVIRTSGEENDIGVCRVGVESGQYR